MPSEVAGILSSVRLTRAINMALSQPAIPFKDVPYDVRLRMSKKLDPQSDRDWRMLAHELGFNSGDIDGLFNNNPALVEIMAWRRTGDKPLSEPMMWFPYKARAQAETNTQFLMRTYCLVPGNSVQNMVAALHLCLRYDVRDILLSAFGHEGEDVMEIVNICTEMLNRFKEDNPDGIIIEPFLHEQLSPGTDPMFNRTEPMDTMEMQSYQHNLMNSCPLPDSHEAPLDLSNYEPQIFPHAGAPGAYFNSNSRKHPIDTDEYGRRVSDGSPSVIKYARSNSQMTDVRSAGIPEVVMGSDRFGVPVGGYKRGSPKTIPRSAQAANPTNQSVSGSWPKLTNEGEPRRVEHSMSSSSVPDNMTLAQHIQPPGQRIHIVIMYGRISKEHMKLIHKEFEAFNKNSFVIASLKPNDNFDSQEIEGWVEKADFIIVFVSELLKRVVEYRNPAAPTKHGNVRYMYEAMERQLRRDPSKRESYIPVLLPGINHECIPQLFAQKPGDVYRLPYDRKNLHFRLNQPEKIVRNFVKVFPTIVTEYVGNVGNSLPVPNGVCVNNNNNHKPNSLPIS